jgi:hypothetical protein
MVGALVYKKNDNDSSWTTRASGLLQSWPLRLNPLSTPALCDTLNETKHLSTCRSPLGKDNLRFSRCRPQTRGRKTGLGAPPAAG